MARHNNTSRSLQIMALQQGWDPNKIVDVGNGPGHPEEYECDIREVGYRYRATPYEHSSTQDPFPGDSLDLQAPFPKIPSGIPDEGEETPTDHGPRANPYPGKPGSEPTRGRR